MLHHQKNAAKPPDELPSLAKEGSSPAPAVSSAYKRQPNLGGALPSAITLSTPPRRSVVPRLPTSPQAPSTAVSIPAPPEDFLRCCATHQRRMPRQFRR